MCEMGISRVVEVGCSVSHVEQWGPLEKDDIPVVGVTLASTEYLHLHLVGEDEEKGFVGYLRLTWL